MSDEPKVSEPQESAPKQTKPQVTEATVDVFANRWLPTVFFFMVAGLVIWGSAMIIAPYAVPILIGGVLVVFTFPWYQKVRERVGGRENLAAFLMLVLLTVVIIAPTVILIVTLVKQATQLFEILQSAGVKQQIVDLHLGERVMELVSRVPGVNVEEINLGDVLYGALKGIPGWVASQGGSVVGGLLNGLVGFVLVMLAAFYFYVEGNRLVKEAIYLSPLPDEYDREIFNKIKGVINATFTGQGLTSLAQGVVTGVGLAIVGIPAAVLWGAVAAVFSLVPMVGSAIVWIPACGYLFFIGGIGWKPIFLLIWGGLVVSTIDNLIRPLAMKGGTEMSGVLLLFAILGGLRAFGFIGLLLGPLFFVMLISMIGIYRDVFRKVAKERTEAEAAES